MTFEQGRYNIKAVSNMLGIQPGTLRAWERRYKIIAPKRNEAGHRLYTENHMKILRWLVSKVEQGFTISQAVSLLEKEELLVNEDTSFKIDRTFCDLKDALLNSLISFDEGKAINILEYAFSLYSVEKVIFEMIGFSFIKAGDQWKDKEITTVHEHYVAAFFRSKLGAILQSFPNEGYLPKAITVCAPQESNELHLLILAFFLRNKGFKVVYLGASVENNDIRKIIHEMKPKFLFLSCTLKKVVEATIQLSEDLEVEFQNLRIGIGGEGCNYYLERNEKKHEKYMMGSTKIEWEKWLKKNLTFV